jgi:hypothetical protein
MRALTSAVVMLAVVVTGWSFGQQPPDKPAAEKGESKRSLEELLASALRHSPDVQVGEAKVREAEAELRRTRLTLLQRIIEAHGNVDVQRATAAQAEATFRRISQIVRTGQASAEEMEKAQAMLAAAKAQLAAAEATLNGLTGTMPGGLGALAAPLGEGGVAAGPGPGVGTQPMPMMGGMASMPGGGAGGFGGGMVGILGGNPTPVDPATRLPRGPMAEKLRVALNAPVKVTPVKDRPLAEVFAPFRAAAKGIPFVLHLGEKANEQVSFSLDGEVPLAAAIQALEDVVPGLKCYVREYGILVIEEGGPPIDGAPLVEFWRMTQAANGVAR